MAVGHQALIRLSNSLAVLVIAAGVFLALANVGIIAKPASQHLTIGGWFDDNLVHST